MLISPPFLQATAPQEIDMTRDGAMALGEKTGKGAFPVSHHFGWHGGVHLTAPGAPGNPEPVRAIADGEVVFARDSAPIPLDTSPTHPLLYYTGWTSNGVMVLKHTTEIGEDLTVTFYSIYQHLHTLENKAGTQVKLKAGDKVYRKEPIGKAGAIYGRAHCIHFEIVTDKENVEKLMGRSQGPLVATEGRRNSVWGDMHLVLPTGTPLYEKDPRTETKPYTVRLFNSALGASNDTLESVAQRFNTTPKRIRQLNGSPARAANWWSTLTGAAQKAQNKPEPTVAKRTIQIPAIHGGAAATPPEGISAEEWRNWQATVVGYTSSPLIVSLNEALGTITLTTRQGNGTITGSCTEKNGGYDLYKTAVKTYPGCPSAGYEMLRFGRVIGPDAPAESDLLDGRLPHFRRIAVPGTAPAFANLNVAGVQAFSDADFPHWLGWTFIDDDTDGNSRCDSTQLVDLIEPLSSTPIQLAMLGAPGENAAPEGNQHKDRLLRAYLKLQSESVRERLSYCVVKQPTEWSRDDFDNRWSWVKDTPSALPAHVLFEEHLSSDAYERLKRHHQALAFWEDATAAGLALDKVHYHFQPMRFIQTLTNCSWLSISEMTQLLPMNSLRFGTPWHWENVSLSGASALLPESDIAAKQRRRNLNESLRKYGLTSRIRLACFFGNSTQETQWFQKFHENSSYWYKPWDGRGFLQLTHAENYIKYWNFRGITTDESIRSTLKQKTILANNSREIIDGHKSMYDATNALSDFNTGIPLEITKRRELTINSFEASDSAGAYWAWTESSKLADRFLDEPESVLKPVETHDGTKHYYENVAFGRVAATVNTGLPSSAYSSIWGIQARFMAFSNAQYVLLENIAFTQQNGSPKEIPQDFQRRPQL